MFWLIVRQYRYFFSQRQHSGVIEWSLERCSCVAVLPLSIYVPDGLSGVWIKLKLYLAQRLCYCSVVCVISYLLQDLTMVCLFFVLALNVTEAISLCKGTC